MPHFQMNLRIVRRMLLFSMLIMFAVVVINNLLFCVVCCCVFSAICSTIFRMSCFAHIHKIFFSIMTEILMIFAVITIVFGEAGTR